MFDPRRQVAHERLVGNERSDAGLDTRSLGFEQGSGVVAQVGLAVAGVSLLLQRLECKLDAGIEARGCVVGETEVDRDAVGGFEADAVDFSGDRVRFGR
jgi:hypothetical protein